jgi:predicted lipoprotein with Yx(FWY)xxD motif
VTNQDGFTLYLFAKDTTGRSSCSDACAAEWPPLTVQPGSRIIISGVNKSLVGYITHTDGTE